MFRALMYLHHYWPCATVSDGNIVWKISLMKMWFKNEAWEIGTPLELHPKSWDRGLMADVFLACTLGYSIFCLQTPVRACEGVDVIFYRGVMEVSVCTNSCVGKGESAMAGAREVWEVFFGRSAATSCLSWCDVKWSYCIFLKMWEHTNEHLWDFSNLIFIRKIRFPISVSEGVSGCIFLWQS